MIRLNRQEGTAGHFPFGGIGVSDAIAQTLKDDGRAWMHAYTCSAHPVGCAVALRTLRIIEEARFKVFWTGSKAPGPW